MNDTVLRRVTRGIGWAILPTALLGFVLWILLSIGTAVFSAQIVACLIYVGVLVAGIALIEVATP